MSGLPGTHQVSPSLSSRTRETRRTQSGLLTEQGSVAPEHRLKCPPVGPATREAVVAAVAMAAVTAGVTTGGVVSEVGVTAAETGDSEEVVTGMVDAEGAEAVPPVTTTEPVAETVVAATGEAGGHLAGQPLGQLQGTGHIQGKGDKMLLQSPSQTHILILFLVIRRME